MSNPEAQAIMTLLVTSKMELTKKIDWHLKFFFPKFHATGVWHPLLMKLILAAEMGRDLDKEIQLPEIGKLLNKEHPTFRDVLVFFQVTQYLIQENN